mgnify:CR=1 FL=1
MIDNLVQEGKDIRLFAHDLVEYLRNLILVKMSNQSVHKLDLPDNLLNSLLVQSKLFSTDVLFQVLEVLSEGESQLKFSAQPRITLELSLIKAAGVSGKAPEMADKHKVLEEPSRELKTNTSGAEKTATIQKPKKESSAARLKDTELSIDLIKSQWKNVLDLVKQSSRSTQAYLIEGEPVELKDRTVILLFKPQMKIHLEKVGEPANKSLIEKVLSEVFQHKLTIQGTMDYAPNEGDNIESQVKKILGDVNLEIIE